MNLQWCDQEPCLGAMCPAALARYGQPTIGHTIPVPQGPHSRAAITRLFAKHFAAAVATDLEGNPRRVPDDLAFTIHTVTTTIDEPRQYYTALYSGTADLAAALRAAPPWTPADDTPEPQDAPPEGRWGWTPVDEDRITYVQTPAEPQDTPPPAPELAKPGVTKQDRNW